MYNPLSEREEFLGKEIVDAAYKVHKELGPAYWKEFMKLVSVTNLT